MISLFFDVYNVRSSVVSEDRGGGHGHRFEATHASHIDQAIALARFFVRIGDSTR